MNIVNNIEGIDLGENLRHFKDFTMPFTPALRGDAINNFEFVKRIHNSFARYVSLSSILFSSVLQDIDVCTVRWICSIQTCSLKTRRHLKGPDQPRRVKIIAIQKLASISLHSSQPWEGSGNSMAWSVSPKHSVGPLMSIFLDSSLILLKDNAPRTTGWIW